MAMINPYSPSSYTDSYLYGQTLHDSEVMMIANRLVSALFKIGIECNSFTMAPGNHITPAVPVPCDLSVVDSYKILKIEKLCSAETRLNALLEQMHLEETKRQNNPGLAAAYEKYQLLLKLSE